MHLCGFTSCSSRVEKFSECFRSQFTAHVMASWIRHASASQSAFISNASSNHQDQLKVPLHQSMPSPVELSLSSLVPTLSPIPDELTNLATSLLAQSRAKAANLKPEEEIGRTYACCHIACQRLGSRLALEIATPAPPVKPRVYNKLHTYLNSVLKTAASKSARAAVQTRTQTQTQTKQASNTPASQSTTRSTVLGDKISARADPSKNGLDGSSTIITPRSRKRKAEEVEGGAAEQVDDTLDDSPSRQLVEENHGDYDTEDADATITPAKRPSKTPVRRQGKRNGADEDDLGAAGILPGLGTMFQPAVDWLSDDRRTDYVHWRKAILREAAAVK
jgi:origin recognition complex subunit 6